jgi:diguanylate cyclase (GGDEF)-like protein
VPVVHQERVAGVLLCERRAPDGFGPADVEVAAAFAAQAGIAVENARLFEEVQRMARTDDLTGTLNRRHFFAVAGRELSRAARYGRPLSAAMLDVDRFKRVNDTYGHAVGDEVLREVARRVIESVRSVDLVGRYGGEEFALLLPETEGSTAARNVAERVRRCVEAAPVATSAGPVPVTVSVGVACRAPGPDGIETLLDRADQALLRAKQGGRNRVESDA